MALSNIGVEAELRWVPAHRRVPGDEAADVMAKNATGWKVIHCNNKRREIDTEITGAVPPTFHSLRAAVKANLKRRLFEEWEELWTYGSTGRTLLRYTASPSKKTLALHRNLSRPLSSVLTQMRMGKIGL